MLPAKLGARRMVIGTLVIVGVVVLLLAVAFSTMTGGKREQSGATGGAAMMDARMAAKAEAAAPSAPAMAEMGAMGGGGAGEGAATAAQVLAVPPAQRKVIKTAQIAVQVRAPQEVEAGTKTLGTLTDQVGGFVATLKVYDVGEGRTEANMTLRMPAGRFTQVLERARALGKVLSDEVSGEEVTAQFIDTEARLRTKRLEEKRLLALLERQGKLSEILEVERELVRVRGEIEQAEGQLRFLSDQVAFSTIQVTLTTEPKVVVPPERPGWQPVSHIKRAWTILITAITRVLTGGIYFVIVGGPLVLLAVVIYYAVRAAARRGRATLPPSRGGRDEPGPRDDPGV